ncbi:MAG: BCD family MFS transporter, partial [Actinomycetota bacterium]
TLGVLNRVMKVDLGIPLLVVTPILAAYNLAAPAAVWIGARSDRHAFRGLHRTPYILGGAVLMAIGTLAAPFVAWLLAGRVDLLSIGLAIVVFAVMGVGMYGSGATYFALLSEAVSVGRERAVAVVYSMLMAGILAGVALSAYVLPHYTPGALLTLHTVVALVIVVCTWWAVRGAEGRDAPVTTAPTMGLRSFLRGSQPRRFFVFMVALTFFAFLQQGILEPFGGDVFGLSVRTTTSFNAIQIGGVLLGMAVAARALSPAIGRRATTGVGMVIAAVGFSALAVSGIERSDGLLYLGIAVMGLGLGVLNVGSLSLMLDMTAGHAAGLAMGLWTVAHAIADGAATASGGVLQTLIGSIVGTDAGAYAGVFVIEALGLLAVLGLLRRIDPERFKQEFNKVTTLEGGTT